MTKLRKTDVIVIDKFSMLDYFLFRTTEGLCRKSARVSRLPWGGRHVTMLGVTLPSYLLWVEVICFVPSFGVPLQFDYSEIKRSQDPVLTRVLTKVRIG